MLQARVPPGRHHVVLRYWPTAFTAGLVLAAVSAAGLAAAVVIERVRRRKDKRAESTPPSVGPPGPPAASVTGSGFFTGAGSG
jgi:hypothetical protein